jgi:hypothetical protein
MLRPTPQTPSFLPNRANLLDTRWHHSYTGCRGADGDVGHTQEQQASWNKEICMKKKAKKDEKKAPKKGK